MRLLVLGGTKFVGRHIVEAALASGHEVTLFNRGLTEPSLFPEVERLVGDRDGDVTALADGRWDAVVDTSGFVPRVVRDSAELLEPRVGRYLFISSVSVYADVSRPGVDESAPLAQLEERTEEYKGPAYGALKALCEAAVLDVYGGRATIVRPGLIAGPWDPTGRLTYWPVRIAEGGNVLAPEPPDGAVQVIDARDLAAWCIRLLEDDMPGTYNAVGTPSTMDQLLTICRDISDADAQLVWAPADWLAGQGVAEWTGLPLWLSSPEYGGFAQVDGSRASANGLSHRALAETLGDTLAWQRAGVGLPDEPAGITREREAELLAALTFGG